jgi:hypothetical protein
MEDLVRISKRLLESPSDFKKTKYVQKLVSEIREKIEKEDLKMVYNDEELTELILSVCRCNDFGVIVRETEKHIFVDKNGLLDWVRDKLLPNTVLLKIDEEDVVKLFIFSTEITYRMFLGGTRATVTQKGFRERRRTFESILVDQFTGKLGEVAVKKFLEDCFSANIELDWEISEDIPEHRSDILNASKIVSIKTSPSLAGVWAEADIGFDYGIFVKCSVPLHPILQFFIEVCGFLSLLNFAEKKIPPDDKVFRGYLQAIRDRVKDYKCGEFKTEIKCFICGYFETSEYEPVEEGVELQYLGKVREERYIVPIPELKWTEEDWKKFLEDNGLI